MTEDLLVSVVVLAGGQSKRLGCDKSLLGLDGQPLLTRTVHRLAALSDDLIVVTNDPARYESLSLPARLVPDERPGEGSLMGIYSGLKVARHPHALAVACDMPFLNLSLLPIIRSMPIAVTRIISTITAAKPTGRTIDLGSESEAGVILPIPLRVHESLKNNASRLPNLALPGFPGDADEQRCKPGGGTRAHFVVRDGAQVDRCTRRPAVQGPLTQLK